MYGDYDDYDDNDVANDENDDDYRNGKDDNRNDQEDGYDDDDIDVGGERMITIVIDGNDIEFAFSVVSRTCGQTKVRNIDGDDNHKQGVVEIIDNGS